MTVDNILVGVKKIFRTRYGFLLTDLFAIKIKTSRSANRAQASAEGLIVAENRSIEKRGKLKEYFKSGVDASRL